MTTSASAAPVAAVVYSGDIEIEPILGVAIARLRAAPLRLGGILPGLGAPLANGRASMHLEDLGTGAVIPLSQELGPGARSCVLDVDGLTRGRLAVQAAIATRADLIVAGKFGKLEASGRGTRAEIGEALAAGRPTLVALRDTRMAAWCDFVGDGFVTLPADPDAIVAWAETLPASGTVTPL